MSTYCSIEDLFSMGLKSSSVDGVDRDSIEKILDATSRKMDSYLRGRGYSVPLVDWGNDVTQCCASIAAWDVLRHLRGVNPDDPAHAALVKAQMDAIAWLRDVAKGVANFDTGETAVKRRRTGVAGFIRVVDCSGCGDSGDRGW